MAQPITTAQPSMTTTLMGPPGASTNSAIRAMAESVAAPNQIKLRSCRVMDESRSLNVTVYAAHIHSLVSI
jgi:hypothetical protein